MQRNLSLSSWTGSTAHEKRSRLTPAPLRPMKRWYAARVPGVKEMEGPSCGVSLSQGIFAVSKLAIHKHAIDVYLAMRNDASYGV